MARVLGAIARRPGQVPQADTDEGSEDLIVLNDPFHGFTIANEAGVIFNPKSDPVIARVVKGEVIGGVIFNGYSPRGSICMHMAGFDPRWISRDLIWVCFDYPFNQLGVKKIFANTPETCTTALKMNRKFGFLREMRVKDVFEDGDLIVMDMYRHECRWLNITPRGIYNGGSSGRQE